MIPGSPPKNVTVEIMLATQIDDSDAGDLPSNPQRRKVRASHDAALQTINEALDGPVALAALKAFLNAEATKRPAEDFYLTDVTKTDERHEFVERTFVDALTFTFLCQDDDAT